MLKSVKFSFEVFPPKTQEGEEKMFQAINELEILQPAFVSVTYGAGGTTRDYTHKIAKNILQTTKLKAAAHLTCVGAKRHEIDEIAEQHLSAGINHIVALRGDPPKGTEKYIPTEGGYGYAVDLIAGLKKLGNFEISVAAFPEKHPQSQSFEQDIEILKAKDDLGSNRAITQFFYDNDFYLRLRDKCNKAQIKMPIVPGIFPINNFPNVKKFCGSCGTKLPNEIQEKFENLEVDSQSHNEAAIELATKQCQNLIAEGIDFFHFYSMNRSDLISQIIKNLS